MGVKGLWEILEPAATNQKLDTLSGQRLAVDASIWLHQFQKALRDKEGNPVQGAHVLGFFRRICKLLFFNIKPVFVFDGVTAPLKRQTVANRRKRHRDAETSLQKTAEKILQQQLRLRAISSLTQEGKHGQIPVGAEYAEEVVRPAHSKRRKLDETPPVQPIAITTKEEDEFNLPAVVPSEYRSRSDPRFADERELRDFIREHRDEVDFESVDFDSETFSNFPVELQYQIILDLKTNSREASSTRVGELLQAPTAIDFSKIQIRNLVHRNTLTEKLFHIAKTGGVSANPALSKRAEQHEKSNQRHQIAKRIASVKGRDYVLVKNDQSTGVGHTLRLVPSQSSRIVERGKIIEQNSTVENERAARAVKEMASSMDDGDNDEEFIPVEVVPEVMHSLAMAQPEGDSEEEALFSDDDENASALVEQNLSGEPRLPVASNGLFSEVSSPPREDLTKSNASGQFEAHYDQISNTQSFVQRLLQKAPPKVEEFWPEFSNQTAEEWARKPIEELIELRDRANRRFMKMPKNEEKGIHVQSKDFVDSLLAGLLEHKLSQEERGEEDDQNSESQGQSEIIAEKGSLLDPGCAPRITTAPVEEKEYQRRTSDQPHKPLTPDRNVAIPQSPVLFDAVVPEQTADGDTVGPNSSTPVIHAENSADELIPSEEADDTFQLAETSGLDSAKEISLDDLVGVAQTANEEDEFIRFISEVRSGNAFQVSSRLRDELSSLKEKQSKEKRDAAGVTADMIRDVQDLLRLFGLPYMTAPMEAEAQCAWLHNEELVDGIITDDSDVFLFGGRTVYKNMFNLNKFIEIYNLERIERVMGLSRQSLILLAYLLGSDYTEGISGIGSVSAMEILKEFETLTSGETREAVSPLQTLQLFRDWTDSIKNGQTVFELSDDFVQKFRKKAKVLELPESFPDPRVNEAYMFPEIDENKLTFQWGALDLDGIRDFMEDKAGYSVGKTDEILVPVINEMDRRRKYGHQGRIADFFTQLGSTTTASHRNARIQRAADGLKASRGARPALTSLLGRRGRGGKSQRAHRGGKGVGRKPKPTPNEHSGDSGEE